MKPGIKKDDFIFSIGFHGETAIVDKQAQRQFGKCSVDELIKAGLFKPAFCSAVYDDDKVLMEKILDCYNNKYGKQYTAPEDLKRLFGVFGIPENVKKVKAL